MTNLVISSIQIMGDRVAACWIIIVIGPLSDWSNRRSHDVSTWAEEQTVHAADLHPGGSTHCLLMTFPPIEALYLGISDISKCCAKKWVS
jgi:hypothetical protein